MGTSLRPLACLFLGLCLANASTQATTFLVTKTADTEDGACNADCSLREAIIAANANPGPDDITLPAGVYTLSIGGTGENAAATGDLDITGNTVINGAGEGTSVIDGGDLDRVIHILGGPVTFNTLTFRTGQVWRERGPTASEVASSSMQPPACR